MGQVPDTYLKKEETIQKVIKEGGKKAVSGSDRANNLDFGNSLHHFVILIADVELLNFCYYQKFNIYQMAKSNKQ